MELQIMTCLRFWSFLLPLVLVVMNVPVSNASAPTRFHNETDRLALLQFKYEISDDPHGILNSWNHSLHHCHWQGVTCDTRHQRVTALSLRGMSLSGSISPHIGNLSFMKFIRLGDNQFHGEIPQEVGRLFRLRFLNLSSNTLVGEIPVNLSYCLRMTTVVLTSNKLQGRIPFQLSNLKKLENIFLDKNNLTGEIPYFMGNLSSLKQLYLTGNNLEGNLPNEIGFLTCLNQLRVAMNNLSGMFPASIYNISSIAVISLAMNSFRGSLPANIGLTLPNLQALGMGGNKFYGNIPVSITNASSLQIFDLPDNKFKGQVPTNLGVLYNLQRFNLGGNLLGGGFTRDLDFIASLTNCSNLEMLWLGTNKFRGKIPTVIANLSSQLTRFVIAENQLSGTIPEGVENLVNLYQFKADENSLSGVIPSGFAKLTKLQNLGLGGNKFSGEVLSTLSNITSLYYLDLSNNKFEGEIARYLGSSQSLQFLDLSKNKLSGTISPQLFSKHLFLVYLGLAHNSFVGFLPPEVGKLTQLEVFNVSYNKISGEIPSSIVDCSNLEHLHMQANFFQGTIPPNLASLKSIQQLDLSNNNLIGHLPRGLEKLQFLRYLNFSYNELEGEIPTTGIFSNASKIMLIGNDKLCGGIPELHLPSCLMTEKKKGKLKVIVILSTALPLTILVLGMFSFYFLIYQKRYNVNADSSIMPIRVKTLLRISYHELHQATSGFSPENLIGSGSFGSVYQARLEQLGNRFVAVKVLDPQKNGAAKSFKAECRALRNIRHKNLVSLLTYCSSIDSKGHEFKALVYEYMENGNLDLWLHPNAADQTTRSINLDLFQRLNIAINVASALHYLHKQSEITIVHCDLKPSNILLGSDLVAHVGDFGLARLLAKTSSDSSVQGTSSAIAIKGSIGYAAPEYGMGLQVSTQGDVYSYGILLLEMFTGKRPTDDMFTDELNLHNYVKNALPEEVFKIVDPLLLSEVGDEIREYDKKMECLTSILKIGVECSATLPNDRMHMDEIVRKLHLIRGGFLGA